MLQMQHNSCLKNTPPPLFLPCSQALDLAIRHSTRAECLFALTINDAKSSPLPNWPEPRVNQLTTATATASIPAKGPKLKLARLTLQLVPLSVHSSEQAMELESLVKDSNVFAL